MPDYTADGIQYPSEGENLKPLNKRFQELAESTQRVIDNRVGMVKITPSSVIGGYVDDIGDIIITDETDGHPSVRLYGVMDWDVYTRYEFHYDFNQSYQDQSYSVRFGKGIDDDDGPKYFWSRITTKRGKQDNDWAEYHSRVPLTYPPGGDTVATHTGKLTVSRAADKSYTLYNSHAMVEFNHTITHVDVDGSYNSHGVENFDSVRFFPSTGGAIYTGRIRVYGFN